MIKPLNFALAAVATVLTIAPAAQAQMFSRADSFSYSGAVPLQSYINFLIGPAPDEGSHALSRNRIELGLAVGAYEFAVFHRNDYSLDFDSQTAEFAWRQKNRQPIPLEQEYRVDVWANQYQLSGGRVGRTWAVAPNLDLSASFSAFIATEGVYGYMGKDPEGQGGVIQMVNRTVAGQTTLMLDGELYADYFYTDDVLFRREVDAPNGKGYTLDMGLEWRIYDGLTFSASFEDLLGKIHWSGLPRTTARATSETIIVDEDGFLEANPYFSGEETFGSLKQPLRSRERLNLSYQRNAWRFGYEYDRIDVMSFKWLQLGYNWAPRWGGSLGRETQTQAWHLGLAMPMGKISLVFDDLDLKQAHTFGFTWDLRIPF